MPLLGINGTRPGGTPVHHDVADGPFGTVAAIVKIIMLRTLSFRFRLCEVNKKILGHTAVSVPRRAQR